MTETQKNSNSNKINKLSPRGKTFNYGPEMPNLVDIQTQSFKWLKEKAFGDILKEISHIEDSTGKRFRLTFEELDIRPPRYTEDECRIKGITYSCQVYINVQLKIISTGEIKEQRLFFGDMPIMTDYGTFIINGGERVVVSQLIRSPGAYFSTYTDVSTNRSLSRVKLLPYRGAPIEMEISADNVIYTKLDRRRKMSVATLLRAFGFTNQQMLEQFGESEEDHKTGTSYMKATLERDTTSTKEEALVEVFQRMRPGEMGSPESAISFLNWMFFDEHQYDLGEVGRYKLNQQLNNDGDSTERTITVKDIAGLTRRLIEFSKTPFDNDIDHLGNRRVRSVGELIQNQLRIGFRRMEKLIRERMTIQIDPSITTPAALINNRQMVAACREFFGNSQLSQFMDGTNPLSELTHKRRLSALGPGGLTRERAGFDVRDVHYTHYGRICPIETPEGPNIGLLGSLATYARINPFGFIETPYYKVRKIISSKSTDINKRKALENIYDTDNNLIVQAGKSISREQSEIINALPEKELKVQPYVTNRKEDFIYLSAEDERDLLIGQPNIRLDSKRQIGEDSVQVRKNDTFIYESPLNIHYIEVATTQLVSACTALIPFLEHDDAGRALMGSNMQRQAVPGILSETPLVGTGMEEKVAKDSGHIILSSVSGIVSQCDSSSVTVSDAEGKLHIHNLVKFRRSNQGTCINQNPIVRIGQTVKQGDVLADSFATDNGELSLGQNLNVALMSWEGFNYEDAIVISEDVVSKDMFASVHIEKFETEARDTKLGPEEITRDISNVSEESLKNLDENGIVRIGAWVTRDDILVGKVTPKGETELTPEERLLRAIFGDKAKDVKDSSLRMPHGQMGKVVATRVVTPSKEDHLPHGVEKRVRVWVVYSKKIQEGDKMAGRHGNKGVIAKVVPREDMPFLADGTPIDIILNPIGVPSRMNLGQLMEAHLGWALHKLNISWRTPVFQSGSVNFIEDMLAILWMVNESSIYSEDFNNNEFNWLKLENWLQSKNYKPTHVFGSKYKEFTLENWLQSKNYKEGLLSEVCTRIWLKEAGLHNVEQIKTKKLRGIAIKTAKEKNILFPLLGKSILYDGKTGKPFEQPITVGNMYMMKLNHLVEDKIHARSTGPYALVTQQPLGGKSQFGGQRLGEMEVWALEAYSAAYTLQEMLTFKSDDAKGRVKAFEAIVKGEERFERDLPESFRVLMKELQGLCLALETNTKHTVGSSERDTLRVPALNGEYKEEPTLDYLDDEFDINDEEFSPESILLLKNSVSSLSNEDASD